MKPKKKIRKAKKTSSPNKPGDMFHASEITHAGAFRLSHGGILHTAVSTTGLMLSADDKDGNQTIRAAFGIEACQIIARVVLNLTGPLEPIQLPEFTFPTDEKP